MRVKIIALCAASCAIATVSLAASQAPAVPAAVSAAVADESRPDSDRQRDVNRKPAEALAFSGIKPGDQVGELLPGRGYYTKLLCKLVGDKGTVSTVGIIRNTPPPAAAPPAGAAPAARPPEPTAEAPRGQQCTNVSAASYKLAEIKFPANLDAIWTSENYHDFRNPNFGGADMAAFNKTVFDALKPGGVFIIEDHNAAAGAGATVTNTLHRIEKATVIAEVTAAGFTLDGESQVLANPADDHSQGPFALKGTSDKFLLKFRKPRR